MERNKKSLKKEEINNRKMEEILQDLGLTKSEAKIYLFLLQQEAVKVGAIIKKTGLQSSTTHNTLQALIEKGIVTYILKGKIKVYQAVDPKQVLEIYKAKEKRFEEILPTLKKIKNISEEEQTAEIYDGTKGVMSMLNELIEKTKPRDIYYFYAVDVSGANKEIQRFFERYDAKRKEKKLIVKGIARKELKPLFEKRKYLQMRYVDFPIPTNKSICNDQMALIDWGEKPKGVLIHSKQIVESEKKFFNELWKEGKE